MNEQAANALIKEGVLGTLLLGAVVVIGLLLRRSDRDQQTYLASLKAAYDARIAETTAQNLQLLELTRTVVTAVTAVNSASAGVKEAVDSLTETQRDFGEALRDQFDKQLDRIRDVLDQNRSKRGG